MTRPAAEMEQSCLDAAARTHMCFVGSWAQWLENQPACPTAEFETESPRPWVIAAGTDQHELLPKAVPQQNRASAEVKLPLRFRGKVRFVQNSPICDCIPRKSYEKFQSIFFIDFRVLTEFIDFFSRSTYGPTGRN